MQDGVSPSSLPGVSRPPPCAIPQSRDVPLQRGEQPSCPALGELTMCAASREDARTESAEDKQTEEKIGRDAGGS